MDAGKPDEPQLSRPRGHLDEQSSDSSPVWFDEFKSGFSRRAHFAVSGNLRDFFPYQSGAGTEFISFEQVLWRIAKSMGLDGLVVYDPNSGLAPHAECDESVSNWLSEIGVTIGKVIDSPQEFIQWHYQNPERLADVESLVLEQRLVEEMMSTADASDKPMSFDELVKMDAAS